MPPERDERDERGHDQEGERKRPDENEQGERADGPANGHGLPRPASSRQIKLENGHGPGDRDHRQNRGDANAQNIKERPEHNPFS